MKPTVRLLLRVATLTLTAASALPAQAQYNNMMGGFDYSMAVRGQIGNSILRSQLQRSNARNAAGAPLFSSAATPGIPASSSSALNYSASSSVSRSVREELADHIAARNPADAAAIRKALSTDAAWRDFSRLLKSFGYSSSNLADVMTGYYVINWEVVNGADASGNTQGIRAVREQLAAALSGNAAIVSLSDAEKQRMAEGLGYTAAIAGAGKNELTRKGDSAALQQLRAAVRQSVLQQQGIDLQQIRLTSQGFAPG
jgi:hypothetical protein